MKIQVMPDGGTTDEIDDEIWCAETEYHGIPMLRKTLNAYSLKPELDERP